MVNRAEGGEDDGYRQNRYKDSASLTTTAIRAIKASTAILMNEQLITESNNKIEKKIRMQEKQQQHEEEHEVAPSNMANNYIVRGIILPVPLFIFVWTKNKQLQDIVILITSTRPLLGSSNRLTE